MPDKVDQPTNDDSPKLGLGRMALGMMALWAGPDVGANRFADSPKRIGPAVLVLWTLVGIGLGALVLAVGIAVGGGGDNPPGRSTLAIPMLVPLLLGVFRLPENRVPALALALVLGGAIGFAGSTVLPDVLGTNWAIFLSLAAGALVASGVYGSVARPAAPAPAPAPAPPPQAEGE